MPLAHALHRISTNVRFLTGSLLLPEYAAALAERLFLTPPKRRSCRRAPSSISSTRTRATSSTAAATSPPGAGARCDAPAVLLAHGWGGHAAQMRGFVPRLLAEGFRVIAYDQPAHGLSEGKLTGLPDFAGALAAVAAHHGNVRHVIAHSLGGACAWRSRFRAASRWRARCWSARPRTWSAIRASSRAGTGCPKRCAAPCRRRSRSASACAGSRSRCRASRRA